MTVEEKERFKNAIIKEYYKELEKHDKEEVRDLIESARANGIEIPTGKQEYINRSIAMTGTDGYIIKKPKQLKKIR